MKSFLVLLAAAAAAVGLAATFIPSPAATVGGSEISQGTLDTQLSQIAHSAEYSCYLSEGGASSVLGAGTSGTTATGATISTKFADSWLTELIRNTMLARLTDQAGIRPTASQLALGRTALAHQITSSLTAFAERSGASSLGCGGSGAAVLASMPESFVQGQAAAFTDEAILASRDAGVSFDEAGIASYFGSHTTRFDRVCVGLLGFATATRAKSAAAALSGGTSYTAEAAAITATTAAKTSEAARSQCLQLTGTSQTPVLDGPVGMVGGPYQESNGYLVVVVTSRSAQPLSTVRPLVVTAVIAAGRTAVGRLLDAQLKQTHVSVDPRYGTLKRATLQIAAPASPPPSALLSTSADRSGLASPQG